MLQEFNTFSDISNKMKNPDTQINFITDNIGLNEILSRCVSHASDIFVSGNSNKNLNVFVKDNDNVISVESNNLKQLLNLAEKSYFGKGSETILDESVRKAKEIKKNNLLVANEDVFFKDITYKIRLGLNISHNLRFELHKLNFYETGSFFNAHKDTLYDSDHIATLLILLPFEFSGGELYVQFENYINECFKRQNHNFTNNWCCFFTDCAHEVSPVTSGTRVTLQYNVYIDRTTKPIRSIDKSYIADDIIENLTLRKDKRYTFNDNVFFEIVTFLTNTLNNTTIGLVLKHNYHKFTSIDNLKGFDKKIYEYLLSTQLFNLNIEAISIISRLSDNNKNTKFYDCKLLGTMLSSKNYNIQNIYVGTSANYKEIENNQYTGNESQAGDNIYTNLVLLINMI